ncbi:MAG: 50S ribosomal protein L11 methyltransferase [Acidobacteriota bacterium]
MVRHWPALDIIEAGDLLLAALDDFAPTAIEERERGVRVFFATREQRDAALAALAGPQTVVAALDVSDEDWAIRSQQSLTPIVVGRIRIVPHSRFLNASSLPLPAGSFDPVEIVIEPSMGFGTGHHATTRLCLAAIQTLDLRQRRVLDVGTGSGILAIAAARLGSLQVHGIDCDADAIQSANDNLALNPGARHATFAVADLTSGTLPTAELVVANLTGADLVRAANLLLSAAPAGGTLVLSGILAGEESGVRAAFSSAALDQRQQEDEWICLTLKKV